MTSAKCSQKISPFVTKIRPMEVPNIHACHYHSDALNETPFIITRLHSPISHRVLVPTKTPNQATSLLPAPEGISWSYTLQLNTPLINSTPLNINSEEEDEEEYLVRDSVIIDAYKFNLRESRHAIKADFNNLPEQDKHVTANVLTELLNLHLGKL